MSGDNSVCSSCGRPLAAGAAFCRGCGAKVAPATRRRGWRIALACVVAALIGAGVATVILLASGEGDGQEAAFGEAANSSVRTVPVDPEEPRTTATGSDSADAPVSAPTAVGAIVAGRYVQAGSFRTVEGAETEQSRLLAAGIEADVVSSDQAQELLPGFQVLLVGPLSGGSEERGQVSAVRHAGVPSAFARSLQPALEISGSDAVVGSWSGVLELSGSSKPGENGPLQARWSAAGDGGEAKLEFPRRNCTVGLSLLAATDLSLSFAQDNECVGAGTWVVRPESGGLALTLLPPNTELIVSGHLTPS